MIFKNLKRKKKQNATNLWSKIKAVIFLTQEKPSSSNDVIDIKYNPTEAQDSHGLDIQFKIQKSENYI